MTRRTRSRPRPALGMQGAAAGRALPRGAAKAMIAYGDARAREFARDQFGETGAPPTQRQVEHLVEVAVVYVALPVDRNQVAAHHRRQVFLPVRSAQELHVLRELPLRHQRRAEALN